MILSETVNIRIKNNPKLNYYLNLGYKKNNENFIKVKVSDLPLNCNLKILVKCDICGNEKIITLQKYNKNIQKYNVYTCSEKCSFFKKIATNNEQYGCDYTFQSEIIKNKIKETCIKKYGVEKPHQNKEIREKFYKTCEFLYKDKNYNNRIKYKLTCLNRFGVDNPSKNEDIKKKRKETCIKKYGVDNPTKNENIFYKIHKNSLKKYNYNSKIYYQGTYEKDFLDKYYNNNNKIIRGLTIKYNNRNYYSDFFLPDYNLIVEIKSTYWYNKKLENNIKKHTECIKQGYNHIFIIDKEYDNFQKIINNYENYKKF